MPLFAQRLLYQLLLWLTLPFIPLRLLLRGFKERGYWRHVGERFGFYGPLARHAVWIHAVSVGEARAAAPLVEKFLAQTPMPEVLMTCMTPAGRDTLELLFGKRVTIRYLPYDFVWAVRRFLGRVQPGMGVIMETELWPNLVREAERAGARLFLVNARMSERSARGYRKFAALTNKTLQGFKAIAAQSREDAERLEQLGAANIVVTGNLKFDMDPPPEQLELGKVFRERIGDRFVWLVASSREGEEKLILQAFKNDAPKGVLLVIVPRHPQRFGEVAALAKDQGLEVQRRSSNEAVKPSTRVWLGDSLGEMFAYYAAADCALIGGSLLPYGGQNLIEACAVGCPVMLGPHTENFKQAAEGAMEHGAAMRVAGAEEWIARCKLLMDDEARRTRMRASGKKFADAHKGASAKVCKLICGA